MDKRKMTELNQMTQFTSGEDFIVVAEFPTIDYALIYRGGSCCPWVAAWCLRKEHNCWSQGHYFENVNEAMKHIQSKLDTIPYNRMNEIASKAIDVLKENELLADLDYEVDLEEKEREWFGLLENDEDEGE